MAPYLDWNNLYLYRIASEAGIISGVRRPVEPVNLSLALGTTYYS